MILAIDVGNTTISLSLVGKRRILSLGKTDTVFGAQALTQKLRPLFARGQRESKSISSIVICSVVPRVTSTLVSLVRKQFSQKVLVIGKDIKVPMRNLYRHPRQVGQDRLVGAYAAKTLYGSPVVVIDLGTAITFDVVSPKGEYMGGAIVPGIRLSAEALYAKTALLPKIKIKGARTIVGRTTQESILSGLFFGYGALCAGMIQQISRNLKIHPQVVLTGGHAELMRKYIPLPSVQVDKDLVFKGINALIKKN